MTGQIIVDTDILIDAGRMVPDAIRFLQSVEAGSLLAVSTITQMEMMVGCQNKSELQVVEKFLAHFKILKLNEQIADRAVTLLRQYRLSHGLLIPDALIAATALSLDEPLATRNQKDYRFIQELTLLSYP